MLACVSVRVCCVLIGVTVSSTNRLHNQHKDINRVIKRIVFFDVLPLSVSSLRSFNGSSGGLSFLIKQARNVIQIPVGVQMKACFISNKQGNCTAPGFQMCTKTCLQPPVFNRCILPRIVLTVCYSVVVFRATEQSIRFT